MRKTVTITIEEDVYAWLRERAANGDVSDVIVDVLRKQRSPEVIDPTDEQLDADYRELASDDERERDALEWSEAFIGETLP